VALPVHAEPVAWLACQYDVIATALIIWATVFYLSFLDKRYTASYALSLVAFVLAIGTKENAFVFPLLLSALHFFVIGKRDIRSLLGVLFVGAAGFALRWTSVGGIGGYSDSAGRSYTFQFDHSLSGLFRRAPATELFGFNWLQPELAWLIYLCAATATLLLVLACLSKPVRNGIVPFGIAWMIIALLPTHSLLYIAPGLTNSRFLYLSSVGLCLMLAALLQAIERSALQIILGVLVLLVFTAGFWHNLQAWRSASEEIAYFISQLKASEPDPPRDSVFIFTGLPDTHRGVFVFAVGIDSQVKFLYGRDDVKAERVSHPTVNIEDAPCVLRFAWDEEKMSLRRARTECRGQPSTNGF
jgi:hypothetical protein